jgi:hypothetical protein
MEFVDKTPNRKSSISGRPKPLYEIINLRGFAETLDFIEQVAKGVADESRDMDQVYEDIAYRNTRHQPIATLSWNKKFPCDIQRLFQLLGPRHFFQCGPYAARIWKTKQRGRTRQILFVS